MTNCFLTGSSVPSPHSGDQCGGLYGRGVQVSYYLRALLSWLPKLSLSQSSLDGARLQRAGVPESCSYTSMNRHPRPSLKTVVHLVNLPLPISYSKKQNHNSSTSHVPCLSISETNARQVESIWVTGSLKLPRHVHVHKDIRPASARTSNSPLLKVGVKRSRISRPLRSSGRISRSGKSSPNSLQPRQREVSSRGGDCHVVDFRVNV